jgi:prenyltransferase beta subunit
VSRRLATLATTAVLAAVVAVAASPAGGEPVAVRVESAEATAPLFDGTVDTSPHPVDGGDGSGSHPCSGSPGAAPSATATGALDDALRGAGISWRGNWDPSFHDFFIDRIGPYASQAPDRYWSLTVNGRFSAGGCLTQVAAGDSIRFFYGALFESGGPEAPGGGEAPPDDPGGDPDKGGAGPSSKRLRRVAKAALTFLREHRGLGEDWAGLALSLHGDGRPAAAARDLVAERLGSQRPDGSIDQDVNATALAVLAWHERRPRAAARAATWLTEAQSPTGGFGYRPGVPADVDTTGLTSWALAIENRHGATARAAAFVRSAQAADGGFPALPGGDSNAQSTGLGLIALRVSGLGPRRARSDSGHSPLDYLASLTRRNGSIAYRPHSSPTPVWTTSQALLGLTTRTGLLDLNGDGQRG